MMALLAAILAAGLWYAFAWAVTTYPMAMSLVLIYGLCPAVFGILGASAYWLWRQTRRP